MMQLSQLGFWMFSGAMGAVGVAATVGVLDQPPRVPLVSKTALSVNQPVTPAKTEAEKVAKLATEPAIEPKKAPVVTPKTVVPAFDILRVEKDGSTLIAGRAEPGSRVEIFDGVTIVASTKAGTNGDFVVILEKPLSPGDHQLGIRATGTDNKIQVSDETGLVSIPTEKDGQMLAMVMTPGEASRIIQKPEAAKPAEPVEKTKIVSKPAEIKPEKTKPVEMAKIVLEKVTQVVPELKAEKAETEATIEKPTTIVPKPAEVTDIKIAAVIPTIIAEKPAVPVETLVPATIAEKPAQPVENIEPEKTPKIVAETKAVEEPVKPVESDITKPEKISEPQVAAVVPDKMTEEKPLEKTVAVSKPEKEVVSKLENEKVAAIEPKVSAIEKPKVITKPAEVKGPATEKSKVIAKPAEVKEPAIIEKPPVIIVEAVEIDGSTMFVAGAAEPGRRVAIYVDNEFIGFAEGSRKGRFLLEVERSLKRGEHLVRADIFDAEGIVVAARAEVPLVHEPDEPPVVVAKVEPAPVKPVQEPVVEKTKLVDVESKVAPSKSVEKIEKQVNVAAAPKSVAKVKDTTVTNPTKSVAVAAEEIVAKPVELPKEIAKLAPAKKPKAAPVVEKKLDPKAAKPSVKKPDAPKLASRKVVETKPIVKKPGVEKPAIEKAAVEQNVAAPKVEAKKLVATKVLEKIAPVAPAIMPKQPTKIEVATATAAPARRVLRTGSSVIIRRGDSLWRISYRTYGRGIRYSTIYQTNLNQLRSPHKIYPGQILKVPKKKFSQQG